MAQGRAPSLGAARVRAFLPAAYPVLECQAGVGMNSSFTETTQRLPVARGPAAGSLRDDCPSSLTAAEPLAQEAMAMAKDCADHTH
jgi:hypothetical protein